MTMKTTIKVEDGSYSTPARLEINLEVPTKISSTMQKRLNTAIDEIVTVYKVYRPAAQVKK